MPAHSKDLASKAQKKKKRKSNLLHAIYADHVSLYAYSVKVKNVLN